MAKGKNDNTSKKEPAKGKDTKGKSKDTSGSSSSKDSAAGGSGAGKLKPATAINVRHILNEKHSTHLAVLEKLNAGENFADVARTMSEDKARQGGALGWKTRGSLLAEFEKVAYELQVSSAASPKWATVKTGEGYHVLIVEGRR